MGIKTTFSNLICVITLFFSATLIGQVQVGSNINGEVTGDKLGTSISISNDGTRIAVGAPKNDENGNDSGHVRVYEKNGNDWVQLGTDIDGGLEGDESGSSISLSGNGKVVVIGAPKSDINGKDSGLINIYKENTDGVWAKLASFNGEKGDKFGTSISISNDGTRIAVGAPKNDEGGDDSGTVTIYEEVNGTWARVTSVSGEKNKDESGTSVSISGDGTKIAVGAPKNDGAGKDFGQVRIYNYDGNILTQLGMDIDGESRDDKSGNSVSLSYDGTIVAIGASKNDGTGKDNGHVRVFKYVGNSWTQFGADIDGESTSDQLGVSVSLSGDGLTLAIGAPKNGSKAGLVNIYKNGGSVWTQLGASIKGKVNGIEFGSSVSLSNDGLSVAIGAPKNDENGNDAGQVRVFNNFSASAWLGGTDWNTAENWSSGSVPVKSDDIIIPDNTNLVISSTTVASVKKITIEDSSSLIIEDGGILTVEEDLIQNGNFTVESGGALTLKGNLTQTGTLNIDSDATKSGSLIVNGVSTGDITYNRHIKTDTDWYLVSSPVAGATYQQLLDEGVFDTGGGPSGNLTAVGFYLYDDNGANKSWEYLTESSTRKVVAGEGISIKLKDASVLTKIPFKGPLATTDVTFNVHKGDRSHYNLVGNPFTAFISSATFVNDNNSLIDNGTIWVFVDGAYKTHNLANSFDMAPGQGFFVKAIADGAITFKANNQSVLGDDTFKKQAAKRSIELFLENNTKAIATQVFYIENNTTGFDVGYDSNVFGGGSSNSFSLFTELVTDNEGEKLSIQTLPNSNLEDMVVPVGVKAEAGKELTFSLKKTNFDSDIHILLEDKVTNTFTRLDEANSTYKVVLTEKLDGIGRFYLHTTQAALSIDDALSTANISIYKVNNTTLKIASLPQGASNVTMFNMLGKKVMTTDFTSNGVKEITLPKLTSGIYLVQLQTENGKLNKKIILE